MQNVDGILKGSSLAKLVQKENFVGWVYTLDYDTALVMTNDLWKANALGVPHNCFLVAATDTFDPDEFSKVARSDREVILLRVVGSEKLPHDDDLVRTKIDHFQRQQGLFGDGKRDYDDITLNQLQFGGLKCRVLGTFYTKDDDIWLGSDLESFAVAARLNVYRPRGAALRAIVNHVDPIRRRDSQEEARQLGMSTAVKPFQIGTVRYTSADRLHRRDDAELVPVSVQPSDFLARRTAVLGMTRTGKSNMIKQMVSVVQRVADEGGTGIGQIIYDVNGEYANANQQDKGAIADLYPQQTKRYRMLETAGFEELQNNFYVQLNEGFAIIRQAVREAKNDSQADVGTFLNTSFDEPDKLDRSAHKRWRVRVAAYQALLHRAEFPAPMNLRIYFDTNQAVRTAVANAVSNLPGMLPGMTTLGAAPRDPSDGLSLDEAVVWFLAAREANRAARLMSTTGNPWLDQDTLAVLNMMSNRNANEAYINGYKVLTDAKKFHSPRRRQEVGSEIYEHLRTGKIVILDLSVGDPTLRERISKQIAEDIFNKSMGIFLQGHIPPNIVVYIEEAHNLIGKGMEITEAWPRLAKEGAKYRIALVYATQEVSSVHPNILANTENWFVTHLNNEREIKELARFYDFADFTRSLMRAQDVGFARVKTLSGPFVVPVQIDKFNPNAEKQRLATIGGPSVERPETARQESLLS